MIGAEIILIAEHDGGAAPPFSSIIGGLFTVAVAAPAVDRKHGINLIEGETHLDIRGTYPLDNPGRTPDQSRAQGFPS